MVPTRRSIPLGTFELARGPGGPIGAKTAFAEKLPVSGKNVRYVKFTILANHDGVDVPDQGRQQGQRLCRAGRSAVPRRGPGRSDRSDRRA